MKNKKKLIPIAAIVIMGIVFTVIVKKSGEPLSVQTILKAMPATSLSSETHEEAVKAFGT